MKIALRSDALGKITAVYDIDATTDEAPVGAMDAVLTPRDSRDALCDIVGESEVVAGILGVMDIV